MDLTKNQSDFLIEGGERCSNDKELEMECIFLSPGKKELKLLDFKRVLNCAKQRWTSSKDGECTLDIICEGDIRITITGLIHIRNYCKNEDLEKLPPGAIRIIRKTADEHMHFYEYGCRVNIKKEESIELKGEVFGVYLIRWKRLSKLFRLKSRYSFEINNIYTLDLTVVKSNALNGNTLKKSKTFMGSNTKEAEEKYEIELEYTPFANMKPNPFSVVDFTTKVYEILCLQLNVEKMLKLSEQKVLELFYKKTIIDSQGKQLNLSFAQNRNIFLPGPQVVSMNLRKFRMMLDEVDKYTITSKTDGLRMIGFVSEDGQMFFLSSDVERGFIYSGIYFPLAYAGTIFDGEYVQKDIRNCDIRHYLIFDCYFQNGKDVRFESLENRLRYSKDIIQQSTQTKGIKAFVKSFTHLKSESFHKDCSDLNGYLHSDENEYKNDGLIFTPNEPLVFEKNRSGLNITSGPWQRLLKWKPPLENTVDFRVIFGENDKPESLVSHNDDKNYQLVTLKTRLSRESGHTLKDFLAHEKNLKSVSKKHAGEIDFLPDDTSDINSCLTYIVTKKNTRNNKMIPVCENGDEIFDGAIVEMKYISTNPELKKWVPRNIRYDKTKPNPSNVAEEIWNIIHNPVQIEMLCNKNSKIPSQIQEIDKYYILSGKNDTDIKLRRFHTTFVKHRLFMEVCEDIRNSKILDLASGMGGDINRYRDCGAHEVIGIEKNLNNIENAKLGAYFKLIPHLNKTNKSKVMFLHGDVSKNIMKGDAFKLSSALHKTEAGKKFKQPFYFDSVSIMFAIHYLFENKKSFTELLNNVNENVKPGGYFFGCCYDGEKLFKSLSNTAKLVFRQSFDEEGKNTFKEGVDKKEEVFKKQFLSIEPFYKKDDKFEADNGCLGKEIFVTVQSIGKGYKEYLVNFTFLVKQMEIIGFDCVHTKTFEEFYNMEENENHVLTQDEQNASFLNRSFVFRKKLNFKKSNTSNVITIKKKKNVSRDKK
jgi:hypothetical protein